MSKKRSSVGLQTMWALDFLTSSHQVAIYSPKSIAMRSYWEARRKISSPIEPHPPGIPCPPGLRQVLSPLPKTPVAARLNSFVRDAVMLSRSKSTIPYFQRRIAIAVLFTTRYSSNPDPRSWGQIAKEISELLGIPKSLEAALSPISRPLRNWVAIYHSSMLKLGHHNDARGASWSKMEVPRHRFLFEAWNLGCWKMVHWHGLTIIYSREKTGQPPVSRFAVTMFIARYQSRQVMRLRRGKTKSGSTAGVGLGTGPPMFRGTASRRFSERRLAIEQIVFADEDHQNCQLGAFSEFETLVCRNSHGDIVPESQGGVWPERHPTVTSKNTQQARGLFAVSMPTRRAYINRSEGDFIRGMRSSHLCSSKATWSSVDEESIKRMKVQSLKYLLRSSPESKRLGVTGRKEVLQSRALYLHAPDGVGPKSLEAEFKM